MTARVAGNVYLRPSELAGDRAQREVLRVSLSPLVTGYVSIIARVVRLITIPDHVRPVHAHLVDVTGVGQPVKEVEVLREVFISS